MRRYCRIPYRLFSSFNTSCTNTTTASNILSSTGKLILTCKCIPSLHRLHAHLLTLGALSNPSVASSLITSYTSFLKPHSALAVFNSIPYPSITLCNLLIRSLTRSGHPQTAVRLYRRMEQRGVQPDKYTFTFVLKACADALDARNASVIYEQIKCRGLTTDLFISTALIDLFCKLGLVSTARELFDSMPVVDFVTWNAMIAGLSRSRAPDEALDLFRRMQAVGAGLNSVTFLNLFPAICQLSALVLCKEIHGFAVQRGILESIFNGLLDAYCKCGRPELARKVFDGMTSSKDDFSWGTMISGYVHNGCYMQALELFDAMRSSNVKLNQVAVLGALTAAGEIGDLERGEEIHDYAVQRGMKFDLRLTTALVIMYARCGVTEKAKSVFENIQEKDVVAWSAIISSFAQHGKPKQALSSLKEMQEQGVKPNTITIVSALPACADLSDLRLGKSVHCFVLKSDMMDGTVGSALVAMYAKCESFGLAHAVFERLNNKEVVSWNALINGYAQIDEPLEALQIFRRLRLTGKNLNHATFVGVLPIYALLSALKEGASIHGMAIKYGLHSDLRVKNATLDLYAKCGDVQSLDKLFAETKSHEDVVSWNTMIAGYIHNSLAKQAMVMFRQMMAEYIKPNVVSLISIIPATTAYLVSLRDGMALHCYVVKSGFESDAKVGNCLVDMYAKCGRLDCAQKLFDRMTHKDTASWNTMLTSYSIHGLSHEAISLFSRMENDSIEADALTYLGVLSACRHGGLVAKGREIFDSIRHKKRSGPNAKHYACMVDLLGRAGELAEAWRLIQKMPMDPDASVWGALLGGCRMYGNSKLGEVALQQLTRLQPKDGAHYAVLSNIYAQTGRWSDAGKVRVAMTSSGLDKTPGCSW